LKKLIGFILGWIIMFNCVFGQDNDILIHFLLLTFNSLFQSPLNYHIISLKKKSKYIIEC